MNDSPGTTAPRGLGFDHVRGTVAMWLFIATEAALFLMLFFAYYYLGYNDPRWPPETPKVQLAVLMLAILLASSAVLHMGDRAERLGRAGLARTMVAMTITMAMVFLIVQGLEYRNHLQTLTPFASAYGSIFYTITTIHGLHLILGLSMLGYVLVLPGLEKDRMPQRPVHNAALYWHFVDLIWVSIVGILYLSPHIYLD